MPPSPQIHPDFDKLGENHFLLKIDGIEIGAFRECTGLAMEREIMEYAEGGQNDFVHKLPGRVKYPNLVLKRGITAQDELMKWFWKTRLTPELKAITVQLRDTTQAMRRNFAFEGAYPLKWTGPNLNAGSDSAATEQLEIVHRGLVKI
jgi:phage tail-like protein